MMKALIEAGEIKSVQLELPGGVYTAPANERHWYTEMSMLWALGYRLCSRCAGPLNHDTREITRSGDDRVYFFWCRACCTGCARVNYKGTDTYWDTFAERHNPAQYIATLWKPDAVWPGFSQVAIGNSIMGVKCGQAAYTSLYPLGLLVLRDSFGDHSNACLHRIGTACGVVSAATLPIPSFALRSGWAMWDVRRFTWYNEMRKDRWVERLSDEYTISAADFTTYAASLDAGIDAVGTIKALLGLRNYGTSLTAQAEMLKAAKAAGLVPGKEWDEAGWIKEVEALLVPFGQQSHKTVKALTAKRI